MASLALDLPKMAQDTNYTQSIVLVQKSAALLPPRYVFQLKTGGEGGGAGYFKSVSATNWYMEFNSISVCFHKAPCLFSGVRKRETCLTPNVHFSPLSSCPTQRVRAGADVDFGKL